MTRKKSIVFGPVNSRRLGISLGIDLLGGSKICSMNCVYCECGETTTLTNKREIYVSAEKIITELDSFLKNSPPKIDVITLGGSGEPLLNSAVKEVILHIKKEYPQFKVAVLTNSVLLHEKQVREEILPADIVIPSIDAFFEESFQKINRSTAELNVNFILDGLEKFADIYKGILWVEYFVISGINDGEKEILAAKKYFENMNLTKIQLNSLDRLGTCDKVQAVSIERLQEIRELLLPLPVEIISRDFDEKRLKSREMTGKFILRREK